MAELKPFIVNLEHEFWVSKFVYRKNRVTKFCVSKKVCVFGTLACDVGDKWGKKLG